MSAGARTLRLLNRIADERVKVSTRKKSVSASAAPSDAGFPEQATMGSAGIIIDSETYVTPPLLSQRWVNSSVEHSIITYAILNDWPVDATYTQTGKMGSSKPVMQDPVNAVTRG